MKTSQTIKFFNKQSKLTSEIREILLDQTISSSYKTLNDYLIKKNVSFSKKSVDDVAQFVLNEFLPQLDKVIYLNYAHMQQSDKWGNAGEQQNKISFFRFLQKLKPQDELTEEHFLNSEAQVKQKLGEYNFLNVQAEILNHQLKNYSFKLLGKLFPISEYAEINRILSFLGFNYYYFSADASGLKSFVFGEAKVIQKQELDIVLMKKEILRSSNVVMPLAALTNETVVLVRNESLESIFYQKWMQVFDDSFDYSYMISIDPFWNISLGIKKKVLELYRVKNASELSKIKDEFIKDMRETIVHHEIGHYVVNEHVLDLEALSLGNATELINETIFASMLEFFADFAPKKGKFFGAMYNMTEIAKKNKKRAEAMFYMYLSDVWFYDTQDEYMFTYSDLMVLVLLKYINKDKSIDFIALENDLLFREKRTNLDKLSIIERIFELYEWDTKEIKTIVESATYKLVNTIDYKKMKQILMDLVKKWTGTTNMDIPSVSKTYWANMIGFVRDVSDSKQKLNNYLDEQEKKTLMKMLVLSCGRKKAEDYAFDHRNYIKDRFIELGILAKEMK